MFGGVVSALIVGFILESTNSYANVVADSYAQGGEDEEFWKGLSEEEKRQAQELLQRVKDAQNGGKSESSLPAAPLQAVTDESVSAKESPETTQPEPAAVKPEVAAPTPAKDPGMFSDY